VILGIERVGEPMAGAMGIAIDRSASACAFAALLLAFALALVSVGAPAVAMGVSPTHVEMTSAGRAARAQITVTNDGAQPMPVEIGVERVSLDEGGRRQGRKAGESFLVFPPQALIAPGASQVFRLQWVGEPALARSESFMIYVNQIPLRMPKGGSGVQLALSMGVLVNVAPPQGQPSLQLVNTSVASEKGRRRPAIVVENASNVHALLPSSRVRLSAAGWSKVLEPADLSSGIGIGLVEPGKRRRFVLPVDLPASVSQVQASLEYLPGRR